MPVEESGNMLIMTLSYARETGDNSLITNYVRLNPLPLTCIYRVAHVPHSTVSWTSGHSISSRIRSSPQTRSVRTTLRARLRTRPTSRSRASSVSVRWARWPVWWARARRALTTPCVVPPIVMYHKLTCSTLCGAVYRAGLRREVAGLRDVVRRLAPHSCCESIYGHRRTAYDKR